MYMQFGCLALDEIIQVSDQPVEPSVGQDRLDLVLVGREEVGDDLPGRADVELPFANAALLLGVVGPVLADVLALLLEQVDRRVELLVRRARRGS